jgi:hypothetical protein
MDENRDYIAVALGLTAGSVTTVVFWHAEQLVGTRSQPSYPPASSIASSFTDIPPYLFTSGADVAGVDGGIIAAKRMFEAPVKRLEIDGRPIRALRRRWRSARRTHELC